MDGLPERFRELRKRKGLTSTALAAPRFSVSYVSQIERGRRKPSRAALVYFSRRLGVSPDFLETGVPDELPLQLRYQLEEAEAALSAGQFEDARRKAEIVLTESEAYNVPSIQRWASCIVGDALHREGRHAEATATYEELLARDDLSRSHRVRATAGLALTSVALGDLKYAALIVEPLLEAEHDPPLSSSALAELHSVLVPIYFERGDVHLAQRAAERALAAMDDSVPVRTQAVTLSHAARVLAERGQWEEALDMSRRARMLMEGLNSRRDVGKLHIAYAFLCLEVSPPRLREAEAHLNKADAILSEIGAQGELALVATERGRLAMFRRKPEMAIAQADRTLHEENAEDLERGRAYFIRGRALAELQRYDEAREAFEQALGIFGSHEAQSQLAATWREVGELAAVRGDTDGAIEAFRAALEAFFPRRFRP
jgi:tetratricopeptide (TPR) repeat protein